MKWEGSCRWETPNTEPLVAASELERRSFFPPGGGAPDAVFGSSLGRYLLGLESLHGRGRREWQVCECGMTHSNHCCTHFAIWSNMECTFSTSLRSLELMLADLTRTRPVDLLAAALAGSLSCLEAELGLSPRRGSLCDSLLTARSILLATSRSEGHSQQQTHVTQYSMFCMCVTVSVHVTVSIYVTVSVHVTVSYMSLCQRTYTR